MNSEILKKYNTLLTESSFIPIPNCEQFSPAGSSWQLSPELGGGHYWLYARKDLFDIKIHDFHFQNDFVLNFDIPEGISITRYDSISGEELNPYRRLSAGSIQTIVGGKQNYKAIIHKRIPIHSVGIEVFPAYYEDYLKKQYPDAYFDLPTAFQCVDQAAEFPAMSKLLFEIENYRGEGWRRRFSTRQRSRRPSPSWWTIKKKQAGKNAHPLSKADMEGLENVAGYIADHYAFDIPLARLASIACMSESKLKASFKRQFGCSVTQYIQGRRMSQAEHLLINTDFTMGQIAQMIGYTTSSRFAELFKKNTGILPIEYRKIARRDL